MLKKWDGNMKESEIKQKFKEKYGDSDDDIDEIYRTLKENDAIPKNEKELLKLFDALDKLSDSLAIDDSDDFD